jgi:predicted NBD/HSP70 family sugar kinase
MDVAVHVPPAIVEQNGRHRGARDNAGEFGLMVPKGDDNRPTVPNFLKLTGIHQVEEWPGLEGVDAAIRDKVVAWCQRGGELLSVPAQNAYFLMDVDGILVCSRLPGDVLQLIAASLKVAPIGSHLIGADNAQRLVQTPRIVPIDETSLNRGACALAANAFLRGEVSGHGALTEII